MSVPWKQAIVVGASSGMGAEIARQLTAAGCKVALVARREAELKTLADELNGADGKTRALAYPHDVTNYDAAPALFQQITRDLGGLDLIVYAAGIMPKVLPDEYTFAKDRAMIEVNVLGAMAWLNEAAMRFAQAKAGTIVGIGSVAGDRGRSGQPGYCTSKAAIETYLESLRNRVGRFGVKVVTIKPGPVDTPMTKDVDKKPMLISAPAAATAILAAARNGKGIAYVPGKWRPIMFVIRHFPSFLFKKMNI